MPALLVLVLLWPSPLHAREKQADISPQSPAQGEWLQVRLPRGTAEARGRPDSVQISFLDRSVPCYPEDSDWICRAAVPADAETGVAVVRVEAGGKPCFTGRARVLAGRFPIEPLRLSDDKKALLEQPGRDRELVEIRSALATESPQRIWEGPFLKPVQGPAESFYGEKRTVDGKLRKGYHRGLDIGAAEGVPVLSSNRGIVVLAGPYIEEGNMVLVNHGQGVISAYLHLSSIAVRGGQTVQKGETLGRVGSTGVSNTPHLHFGLYLHGAPIDPLAWLRSSR